MNTLNPRLASLLSVALMAATSPATAQQLTPRTPGLWQVDSQVQMQPLGMNDRRSEKLCITPELARRDGAPPSALQEDGWKCRNSLQPAGAERLSFVLECKKDGDAARGRGEVQLTGSKAFKGQTRIEAQMEGMKVSVVAEYQGRFLAADCGKAPLMRWEGVTETPRK
jgi:Protein of unknown function (DUF3617)